MICAVAIGETPPAVQLTEYQIHPAPATLVLKRHQQPRRCQKHAAVGKRLVQIARGVQHVGRDDHVVGVELETLIHGVLFDIQYLVVDRSAPCAETRFRFREKACGDVGVHVVKPAGRKLGQDAFGRRPDSGPHLQHAQLPSVRQLVHERANDLAQHPVRRPPDRSAPIEITGLRFRIAEQQRQRILIAAKHIGQGTGTAPKQPDLVRRVREALGYLG